MVPEVQAMFPKLLEENGWTVWHLGPPDRALFLCDRTTAQAIPAASTTYRYRIPYDITLHKFVWYQVVSATGVEDDDPINIRLDIVHPNGSLENIYYKQGVAWATGGSRNTGKTFMPACDLVLTMDGTATNSLYFSIEIEVWKQ